MSLTNIYVHDSARAKCSAAGGLGEVYFSGAVSLAAVHSLAEQTSAGWMADAPCVIYLDKAVLLFDWADAARLGIAVPRRWVASAIVVSEVDLAAATRYCALMAQLGILRMAFRPGEERLARQWALTAAGLASPLPCRRESIRA